ncbi:MAG TPA: hypothetical protein VGM31_01280 [Puia sp.]|jgi:hypothetical protein
MRHILPFLAVGLIMMSSCSSSRKAAQTPDDVYYSPGANAVAAASDEDAGYYSPRSRSGANNGEYYSTAPSDNYIRMKSQDDARWSYFDDYNAYDSYYSPAAVSPYYSMGLGYGYPMYGSYYGMGYGLGLGFGDPYFAWNSYFMWNSWYNPYFYNPYYGGGAIVMKGSSYNNNVYTHLRAFNGTSYRNGLVTRVSNSNNRSYRPAPTAYSRDLQSRGNGNRYVNGYSNGNNGNRNYNYRPTSSSPNTNSTFSNRPNGGFSSQPVRSYSPPSGGGGGGMSSRPARH